MAIPDIYFDENYGKLYEKAEHGISEVFACSCDYGTIKNQFIKRQIPIEIGPKKYFDLVTPYGYGGPIIVECEEQNKEKLVRVYHEAFSQYCKENHIVSEFIRFHPIINNAKDFESVYQVENIRKTVGTNLKDYENPIEAEFSKSCRKNIRRAIRKGISYKVTLYPDSIASFKKVYYSTMDRNNAIDYYYFADEYFDRCLKYFRENIVLVDVFFEDEVINAGIFFISNKTIHTHLSGTLSEYLYLAPAYMLRYAITLWGKENGYEMIHHGGGRSNAIDDNLYLFKKQFGKNTEFDFCIGKKIWDIGVYLQLCSIVNTPVHPSYFPTYRG